MIIVLYVNMIIKVHFQYQLFEDRIMNDVKVFKYIRIVLKTKRKNTLK